MAKVFDLRMSWFLKGALFNPLSFFIGPAPKLRGYSTGSPGDHNQIVLFRELVIIIIIGVIGGSCYMGRLRTFTLNGTNKFICFQLRDSFGAWAFVAKWGVQGHRDAKAGRNH
jgi:hypothetical protein